MESVDQTVKCEKCGETWTIGQWYQCPHDWVNIALAGDEIDVLIKHGAGLINPDGTPKRYRSRTELQRACNVYGWSQGNDTPKPYRVNWSGIKRDRATGKPVEQ